MYSFRGGYESAASGSADSHAASFAGSTVSRVNGTLNQGSRSIPGASTSKPWSERTYTHARGVM